MTDYSTLEPLTRQQTSLLRSTVEDVCVARGVPCAPHGHDAYQIDDVICGLANLAAYVALIDEDHWPAEVHKWLDNTERIKEANGAEVTAAQLYPRLVRDFESPQSSPEYPVRQIIPGFTLIVAADYPTHVVELPDATAFVHLGELEHVSRIAVNNLHRLPVPSPSLVDLEISRSPHPVAAFEFEDFFAPSRLLYAKSFVDAHLPPSEHGFLVAAPTRDILMFLPVDPENILEQVNVFANTVDGIYRQGPGATSEVTYHLSPSGDVDLVAYLIEPDKLYFRPNDYLGEQFFNAPGTDV